MTYPEHIRAILRLGLPLIGSNLVQYAIWMTDSIMLGWYDVTALAAVTVANSLSFLCFIVGSGFGRAVTPLVAEAEEQGDTRLARRATRMAIWLSVIYGLCLIPAYLMSGTILRLLGQEVEVTGLAQQYLTIWVVALIPSLLRGVLESFVSALEHTQVILMAAVGSIFLNAGLNWVLIFGRFGMPELGVRGAAIASVVTTIFAMLWLVVYILRRLPDYEIFRNFHQNDPDSTRRVFALGVPIGLTALAEGGLFSASSIMMGWLGTVPLAAHGIALQLASAAFMAHLGLSQAATVRAGRAFGRRDGPGLRRGGVAALMMSGLAVAVTILVFLTVPEFLIGLFLDPNDPARDTIVGIGVALVAMAALFQLVDAAQVMFLGLLRGLQDTRVPMQIAIGSYWGLGLPAAYVLAFPMGWGAIGLWAGLCVGLAAAAVMMGLRFRAQAQIG